MRKPIGCALALALLAGCAASQTDPFAATVPKAAPSVPSTSLQDQTFAVQAAQNAMFMVQASQVVADKAPPGRLRTAAVQLMHDHGGVLQRLKELAPQKGISLQDTLAAPDQDRLIALKGARGAALGRLYREDMIAASERGVRIMRQQVSDGTDPDLRSLAAEVQPHLEAHAEALRVW